MQDYKLFSRVVHAGATVYSNPVTKEIAIQNLDEATEYLNAVYLAEGYVVQSVDFLGELSLEPGNPNAPRGLRFAWHLVKDVKSVKANDK